MPKRGHAPRHTAEVGSCANFARAASASRCAASVSTWRSNFRSARGGPRWVTSIGSHASSIESGSESYAIARPRGPGGPPGPPELASLPWTRSWTRRRRASPAARSPWRGVSVRTRTGRSGSKEEVIRMQLFGPDHLGARHQPEVGRVREDGRVVDLGETTPLSQRGSSA